MAWNVVKHMLLVTPIETASETTQAKAGHTSKSPPKVSTEGMVNVTTQEAVSASIDAPVAINVNKGPTAVLHTSPKLV